jgi:hypothetical protein
MIDMRSQLIGSQAVHRLVDFGMRFLPDSSGGESEFDTGTVKAGFGTITALHQAILQDGFQLHQNDSFGPPGGRQLFYVQDCTWLINDRPVFNGILVRIKTRGNAKPPRKRQPHMSISMYTGGLGWDQEQVKFDVLGRVTPKKPPAGLSADDKDAWAHACHYNFLSGFNFSGADNLRPGNYALREAFWKASRR